MRLSTMLALVLVFSASLFAQANKRPSFVREDFQKTVVTEAVVLPSKEPGTVEVQVYYRINPSFFVPVRQNTTKSYAGKGEFFLEFLDEHNISVAHEYRVFEIPFTSASTVNVNDLQGRISFTVRSGVYKLAVELKDMNSTREFRERGKNFQAALKGTPLEIYSPFYVLSQYDTLQGSSSFLLINRGAIVPFGSDGGVVFACKETVLDSLSVHWRIKHKTHQQQSTSLPDSGSVMEKLYGYNIDECERSLCLKKSHSPGFFVYSYIPLPFKKLEPGMYELHITLVSGVQQTDTTLSFDVVWLNKPRSLGNQRLALDALRYIAADSIVDDIGTLTSPEGYTKFKKFWKQFVSDTTRAYNPVMAEYYHRVDEAIARYSSEDEDDGYKSDRGKAYILYGSPAKVERKFKPGSVPLEIWTYERLRKRFYFSDPERNGTYRFLKEEEF